MKRIGLFVAVVAVFLSANFAAAFDEVVVAKRTVLRGTILAMSPVEVTIDINRRKITLPVNEIVSIKYDREPLDLTTARRFVRSGEYNMALQRLNVIKEANIGRDLILADIAFYKVYANAKLALGGVAGKVETGRDVRDFIEEYATNYHYFEALEVLGDLSMAAGSYTKATGTCTRNWARRPCCPPTNYGRTFLRGKLCSKTSAIGRRLRISRWF